MSLHLFSTPVQCTRCGTVVEDPTQDRCPNCGNLMKERRTPRRLAGVETRYGSLRMLLNAIRFLAVLVVLLGALVFFSTLGDDGLGAVGNGLILVGSIVVAVIMLAVAGMFVLMIDIEENTRSSFRLQQLMLEELEQDDAVPGDVPVTAVPGDVPITPAPPAAGAR